MSMIIEVARKAGPVVLVLGVWAFVMLAMPFVGPPGRRVAVIGEANHATRAIAAAGGQVLEVRGGAVLARSDRPDFVRRLYASGARLVIEGRIGAGCFPVKAGE